MKIGMRKPSPMKSLKARTTGRIKRSVKSAIDPTYGKKGTGWVKDPKKAAYNAVYRRTTVGIGGSKAKYNSAHRGKMPTGYGHYEPQESHFVQPTERLYSPAYTTAMIVASVILLVLSLILLLAVPVFGIFGLVGGVLGIIWVVKQKQKYTEANKANSEEGEST